MEGEEYENNDLNCRADNARSYQDAILIIKECETIIQRQKKDHISTVYRQGCIFNRFKDSNKFLKIMKKSGISISTIHFKMNLMKILHKFPKLKKLPLLLHFLKDYAKNIKKFLRRLVMNSNRHAILTCLLQKGFKNIPFYSFK